MKLLLNVTVNRSTLWTYRKCYLFQMRGLRSSFLFLEMRKFDYEQFCECSNISSPTHKSVFAGDSILTDFTQPDGWTTLEEDRHDMHSTMATAGANRQFFFSFFFSFYFGFEAQLHLKSPEFSPFPATAEKTVMSYFYKSFG